MTSGTNIVRLTCPTCGHEGDAVWGPGVAGVSRQLDKLSSGFLSIDTGENEGPRIVCQTCRTHPDERVNG